MVCTSRRIQGRLWRATVLAVANVFLIRVSHYPPTLSTARPWPKGILGKVAIERSTTFTGEILSRRDRLVMLHILDPQSLCLTPVMAILLISPISVVCASLLLWQEADMGAVLVVSIGGRRRIETRVRVDRAAGELGWSGSQQQLLVIVLDSVHRAKKVRSFHPVSTTRF